MFCHLFCLYITYIAVFRTENVPLYLAASFSFIYIVEPPVSDHPNKSSLCSHLWEVVPYEKSDHRKKSKFWFLSLTGFRGILSIMHAQSDLQPIMKCNIFFIVLTNWQFKALDSSRNQMSHWEVQCQFPQFVPSETWCQVVTYWRS